MPVTATPKAFALLRIPMLFAFLCYVCAPPAAEAQNIQTRLQVFDNIGNSTNLFIGIHGAASDAIDPGLGEVELPPYVPGNYDARLIDNDIRTPSLLGNGVEKDLRGIYTSPPIVQTYEIRVRRGPGASSTWMRWDLPVATGITNMRLVSYPSSSVLDVDMTTTSQVLLPVGTNRYLVQVVYGAPVATRYTLNVDVDPPNTGFVFRTPFQIDYAPGQAVALQAFDLGGPDTCWTFSHWEGALSGNSRLRFLRMDSNTTVIAKFKPRQYAVSVSAIDTFFVATTPPDPQMLYIDFAALACNEWTATSTVPWLSLSRSSGVGSDSLEVRVITSAVPCPGMHAGTIEITSPFGMPQTTVVPVLLSVGKTGLTATVTGTPSVLSCQAASTELISIDIANSGLRPITFSTLPDLGEGFVLKSASLFPLTVLPMDTATLLVEFAPTTDQRGQIVNNVIMQADDCGKQLLFQLEGTRISPTVSAMENQVDFGKVYACANPGDLEKSVMLVNYHSAAVNLSYAMPAGVTLVSGPSSIAGGDTVAVVIAARPTGPATISGTMVVTGDYGVCSEMISVDVLGSRSAPGFIAEAEGTPGMLPPQVFDKTCVGDYSPVKNIYVENTGDEDLMITLTVPAPFELDAFTNNFVLPAGERRAVPLRFHPVIGGTFEETLTIAADLCGMSKSVAMRGTTFEQQVLTSSLTPPAVTLSQCEVSTRIKLTVINTGSETVTFDALPQLPRGYSWDAGITMPVVIPADPTTPFEAFLVFAPPAGEGGSFGGSVQWFGNPCGSTVYFTLTGERVLPQIAITPETVDFGSMVDCGEGGTGATRTIRIENNSSIDVTMNASAPSTLYRLYDGVTDFPTEGVIISAGSGFDLGVEALKGKGGSFTDDLDIEIIAGTAAACREDYTVELTGGRFMPEFVVRENGYTPDFGDVCVNSTVTHGYIIENSGDMPLTITSDGFDVLSPFQLLAKPFRVTIEPGKFKEFPVRYTPSTVGQDVGTLFFTDNVCGDSVSFSFRGRGVQPSMEITGVMPQGTISLVSCEPSTSRQITGTVRNSGSTPIIVRDGSVLPAGFEYDPKGQFPFTLAPGQSRPVVVRFTGTDPGYYSGMVNITAEPCELSAGFPISVELRESSYSVSPASLEFGTITVCPGGEIKPADLENMTEMIVVRNTGQVPVQVAGAVLPNDNTVSIISPITWPITVDPGEDANIIVRVTSDPGETVTVFQGDVQLRVTPGPNCPEEIETVSFAGEFTRVAFAFEEDSLTGNTSCVAQPVELTATLRNLSAMEISFDLGVDGSSAFTIMDGVTTVTVPALGSREVKVLFDPVEGEANEATLYATDNTCGSTTSTTLIMVYQRPELTLSCSLTEEFGLDMTARPGDYIEIPVFLSENFPCDVEEMTANFTLQFDGRDITPIDVVSLQGNADFDRVDRDHLTVRVDGGQFERGRIATLIMEVLVGREESTEWSIESGSFSPSYASLSVDQSCRGTITLRPRNGVATFEDLGITTLNPPTPNVLTGAKGKTRVTFSLMDAAEADLRLYDILGVEQRVIANGRFDRGSHTVDVSTAGMRPGIYFIVMKSASYRSTQKLILAN